MMNPVFDFQFTTTLQAGKQAFQLNCQCLSFAKRLAIVGASGSGKSVTLRLLAGLMKPQSGWVRINGNTYGDVDHGLWLPPPKRKVGFLFQDYALFPHLTVAQNIAFGLNLGWRNPSPQTAKKLAKTWLDKMQLTAFADHYPHQISGGQRQRTALARTCITQPQCLLLDEPFSALDKDLRTEMRNHLLQLQMELNIPTLLITHDPSDSDVLADEVAHMRHGVLQHIKA